MKMINARSGVQIGNDAVNRPSVRMRTTKMFDVQCGKIRDGKVATIDT
jgi:hypothetical protein